MGDLTSTKIPPVKGDRSIVRSEGLKKTHKVAKADNVASTINSDSLIIFRKKFHFLNDLVMKVSENLLMLVPSSRIFDVGLSIQARISHARMLKYSDKVQEVVVQPSKVAPKRSRNEGDAQASKKKMVEEILIVTNKSHHVSPSRSHIPDDILKYQCVGQRRTEELVLKSLLQQCFASQASVCKRAKIRCQSTTGQKSGVNRQLDGVPTSGGGQDRGHLASTTNI
ncbi:hypothetical protein M5K25_020234 [Dendrobium thyrsiflorum]|uniref:Uncharacterized protein n=1 Tax=Dendrobium thyrsiflorum TaxID=117978 RepID=A0ABD0UGE0_DENTH